MAKKESPARFKNFPMVPRVVYGAGCFDQLGDILLPKRKNSEAPIIYLVDEVFEHKSLPGRLPVLFNDKVIFISADESIINDDFSNVTYYGNVKSKVLKNESYE